MSQELSHVSIWDFLSGIDYLHEDLRHSYVSYFPFVLFFKKVNVLTGSTIFSKSTNISESIAKRGT